MILEEALGAPSVDSGRGFCMGSARRSVVSCAIKEGFGGGGAQDPGDCWS